MRKSVLKIGALNCQGLKEKLDDPELLDLLSSCDIFGVSETWFGDKDSKDVDISNYKFYPYNRKKIKGTILRGGVGLFIKANLKQHIKILYCMIFPAKTFYGVNLTRCILDTRMMYILVLFIYPQNIPLVKRN